MKKTFPLLCICFSCLVFAQVMAQGTAFTLGEKHYGNVGYVSGGIGDEERDEIRARERDFNLKLLFSERDGSYLGDVDVLIINPKGEPVLDVKSVGPFLLVRLPGGNYRIKVSANGLLQQGKLSIPINGRREEVFRW